MRSRFTFTRVRKCSGQNLVLGNSNVLEASKVPNSEYSGHLRYLKLGCLENPTYVEVISDSRASLPMCNCISTLLVSNSVMTKPRLCRSDKSLPTEKRTLVSPFLCRTLKSKSVFADLISTRNLSSLELFKNVLTCVRSGNIHLKSLSMG